MELRPTKHPSSNISELKHRLYILRKLMQKFTVNNLKQGDIKIFYYYLKRILVSLHLIIYCEIINIEIELYTKEYIQNLIGRTIIILYRSQFVRSRAWRIVFDHQVVDRDARILIKKISNIMAFSHIHHVK